MNLEIKEVQDEILSTTKSLVGALSKKLDSVSEELLEHKQRTITRLDDIQVELGRPGIPGMSSGHSTAYKSAGARLIEKADEMRDSLARTRGYIFQAGSFFPETKTVVDSAAVGFSTPGVLSAERIGDGILPLARRRLMIRDLMVSKPVTTSTADWVKESSFTSNASPQTESSTKGESTFAVAIASARIPTIAHFTQVSMQVLDDLPGLKDYLDNSLIYYLKLKEESEILSGDGLGVHMSGITTQATAYAGTYAVGADTKLDKLNWYILELQNADENPTGIVLNPTDYRQILSIKNNEGGVSNAGTYVIGDPAGGYIQVPTLWGLPVVISRSMAAGKALVGDFTKAIIANRMDAIVDMSNSHSSNFSANVLALRAELRSTVCVLRPGAFRYGSL